MKEGHYEGAGQSSPEVRNLFTRKSILASEWYRGRLSAKQRLDVQMWQRHVKQLETFLGRETHTDEAARLGLAARLKEAQQQLRDVGTTEYLARLEGTLGVDASLVPEL